MIYVEDNVNDIFELYRSSLVIVWSICNDDLRHLITPKYIKS